MVLARQGRPFSNDWALPACHKVGSCCRDPHTYAAAVAAAQGKTNGDQTIIPPSCMASPHSQQDRGACESMSTGLRTRYSSKHTPHSTTPCHWQGLQPVHMSAIHSGPDQPPFATATHTYCAAESKRVNIDTRMPRGPLPDSSCRAISGLCKIQGNNLATWQGMPNTNL
jgi:hypothetical protein